MIDFLTEFLSLIFNTISYDFIIIPVLFALFVAFAFIIKNLIRGGEN